VVGRLSVVKGVIDEAKMRVKMSVAEVRDNMARTVFVSQTLQTAKRNIHTFSFTLDPPDPPCRLQTPDSSLQFTNLCDPTSANLENTNSAKLPHYNNVLTKDIHTSNSTQASASIGDFDSASRVGQTVQSDMTASLENDRKRTWSPM